MAISDQRKDYQRFSLDRGELSADPLDQFQRWFDAASGRGGGRLRRFGVDLYKAFHALFTGSSIEANAMALATADKDGRPAARTVLLKGVDARGFTFFTNYRSEKGRELAENPRAALMFYWADLERQVRIAGRVTQLPREESEAYFLSRPRGSRIAAWASEQSAVIANRGVLEARFREIEAEFANRDVPLAPNWGGYLLKPEQVEFWQGRPSRMHDRFRYTLGAGGAWEIERLAP